jgi:REP element-mobilizing transposase RayT
MGRKRKFYSGAINHIYQKSIDGNNLFYGDEDFISFFTIMSICAKNCNIQILLICIMYNHFHALIRSADIYDLSKFMDRFTSWYVMDYNFSIGRKGKLLKKNFGSAPKWNDKSIRSAINYVGNNPVEKHLCAAAEEYRWNFLAYYQCNSPFSAPLIRKNASKKLRRALAEVDSMHNFDKPIKCLQAKRLLSKLTKEEADQLIDYIITLYSVIDYNELILYYGSYEKMLEAMRSNTGSEHEIQEEWYPESDKSFQEMTDYTITQWPMKIARQVSMLDESSKTHLLYELKQHTSASNRQICKFLHINSDSKPHTNGG